MTDHEHPPLPYHFYEMLFTNFVKLLGPIPVVVIFQHSPTCPVDVMANVVNTGQTSDLLTQALDRIKAEDSTFTEMKP